LQAATLAVGTIVTAAPASALQFFSPQHFSGNTGSDKMFLLKNVPIRQKLRRLIVLTSAAALLLACGGFMGYTFITARSQLASELQRMTDFIGVNAAFSLIFSDAESARETLSALGTDPRIRTVQLFDADGKLFTNYRRERNVSQSLEMYLTPGIYFERNGMIISRPIIADGEQVGIIVVSAGLGHVYRSLRRYAAIAGWVLLVSLAVAFGLSTVLEGLISRPLLSLTETAARVSESGDYSVRAKAGSDDELGQLIDNFNEMLQQIEERDVALQEVNDRLEDRVHERTDELEREVQIRAATEADLRASLAEKDVLLKEIHHRVKNNLQVISSLLNLQTSHVEDERVREILTTSQDRLRSIALVHEMFYQSDDLARIDLAPFLSATMSYLLSAYSVDPKAVHAQVECTPMHVAIDTAIPLGLITHELISNALKYAFPENRHGLVRVALQPNGSTVHLTVDDDGVGIPESVRWDRPASLGLQMVHSLTRQIRGQIELEQERGTRFIVSIPDRLFDTGD
jgi:two-component sensor histidine kinase/HAMP domain-containing protein